MPYKDTSKRAQYHRDYMRAYYHRRKHEERVLLGRKNTTAGSRQLPVPTRACPEACEMCGKPEKSGNSKALALDHCHQTGRFRGWLCNDCNLTLGRAGDSLAALERWAEKATAYLRRAESQ